MAATVFLVFFLAMAGVSDAAWCVCKGDLSNPSLQKTLDYACGAGADCNPILQNGPCFNPNTVIAHCSYAANSYYQRKGQAQGSCDFSGTAAISSTDPSGNGCTYPATSSAAGTGSSTPSGFTPTQTGTGGLGSLGPSGSTTSIDGNGASGFHPLSGMALVLSGLAFLSILL
ncbi:Glucan endo-1,3-beta-glucosidase-like protein 3 [Apostasia shenzhenica]|uniref:Glucan endo-1,3-beta-glucosidase-like protein 3 n=1 Tax=Apostasia shenzhenica TaxID=1088818 RepID=A0A2I0A4A7_9ASPA|nr:Glucan endo-1,3-beta-glucosidase-like protein 3 [Apostasia shenzhenica]